MHDRMSLYECQEKAKHEGFDTATFDLCGPTGRVQCKWLNAYFGFIQKVGDRDFFMSQDLMTNPLVWCENFSANRDESAGSQRT